jgi:hypothetical protein
LLFRTSSHTPSVCFGVKVDGFGAGEMLRPQGSVPPRFIVASA